MSISLSSASLSTYIQMVSAASNIIEKAEEFCSENDIDTKDIVEMQLHRDMAPFTFQVFSIVHHSVGAIDALKTGEFGPPKMPDNLSFDNCKNILKEAEVNLKKINPSDIDNLSQQEVVFKMGSIEWPFTASDFILSFSLPNFYFHLTTFYDMLRMKGLKIGKLDFVGQMKLNN
tara:strand:+ start:1999 stop:2520 length:522 start_codon:yes stop_codon:yes gene_type:complete